MLSISGSAVGDDGKPVSIGSILRPMRPASILASSRMSWMSSSRCSPPGHDVTQIFALLVQQRSGALCLQQLRVTQHRHSAACAVRGSYWPGNPFWRGWPSRRFPWPGAGLVPLCLRLVMSWTVPKERGRRPPSAKVEGPPVHFDMLDAAIGHYHAGGSCRRVPASASDSALVFSITRRGPGDESRCSKAR